MLISYNCRVHYHEATKQGSILAIKHVYLSAVLTANSLRVAVLLSLESVYTFSKLIEDDCNPFLVLLGQNVVEKSRFTSSYEIWCLASYTIIGG